MIALAIANLPQLALGACWTLVAFAAGRRFERWRRRRTTTPPSFTDRSP
jgi:hypothetical protein